ncbi:MAG: ATP-binding cassette domain-containing protein [Alphaproteobacteria bacterium]
MTPLSSLPLEFRNVSVLRGERALVSGLSFSLHANEGIIALLGANGAGKTTILRLIHGLLTPDQGTILWGANNKNTKTSSLPISPPVSPPVSPVVARRLRMGQGFVSQAPVLLARSVAKNMSHALSPFALNQQEQKKRIQHALKLVNLANYETHAATELSAGEAQRLCLARALARRPELLLLDEATAFLDSKHVRAIETAIKSSTKSSNAATKNAKNAVTVFVTQDPVQAQRLAQRVLFLEEGQLRADMPADNFFHNPPPPAYAYLQAHSLLISAPPPANS